MVVVLQPEQRVSPVELIEFATRQLPEFTVPRYIEIVAKLPKTPTEKVQKAQLRRVGISATTDDHQGRH